MAKPKRTEAELIALLNAALRRTDVCDSVTVAAIHQVEDKTANWDADALRGSGVRMPTDACQFFYECKGCGERLKPKPGDCCVFCSYGSVPCPPVQARGCCR